MYYGVQDYSGLTVVKYMCIRFLEHVSKNSGNNGDDYEDGGYLLLYNRHYRSLHTLSLLFPKMML